MQLIETLLNTHREPALAFSAEEYRRRQDRVRREMAARDLDALVLTGTPGIGYLTGYDTAMPPGYTALIIPADGEPVFHCSELEAPCMLYFGDVRRVEAFNWYESADTSIDLARMLAELGLGGATIGLELRNAETFASGAIDAYTYLTLQERLPEATLVEAGDIVLEARLRKTPEEIASMRVAGGYTWAGLSAGIQAIRGGVSDNDVQAEVYRALIAAGSESPSIDPMIMSGERTGWLPHLTFRRERIGAGDAVFFELTGTHLRYSAPSMRSAVVGKPSPLVARLAEASINVLELLLETIRPGLTGDDIAQVAARELPPADEAYWHGAFGYAIGIGYKPTWTETDVYIAEGAERELEPGMCFHLPISLWVPGGEGIGFSESVVVTEDGCECLTPRKDLFLVERPL